MAQENSSPSPRRNTIGEALYAKLATLNRARDFSGLEQFCCSLYDRTGTIPSVTILAIKGYEVAQRHKEPLFHQFIKTKAPLSAIAPLIELVYPSELFLPGASGPVGGAIIGCELPPSRFGRAFMQVSHQGFVEISQGCLIGFEKGRDTLVIRNPAYGEKLLERPAYFAHGFPGATNPRIGNWSEHRAAASFLERRPEAYWALGTSSQGPSDGTLRSVHSILGFIYATFALREAYFSPHF